MRYRSVALILLGGVIFGLTLLAVIQVYPREPCRGVDCGIYLFGLIPHLIGSVLGSLLLAAGTYEWATGYQRTIRLLWFPSWGFICGGIIGTYVGVFGPTVPTDFFWFPVAVGGVVGVIPEIWSWAKESEQSISQS